MSILLGSVIILFLSGLAALAAGKSFRWSTGLGAGGTILACIMGFYPALSSLLSDQTDVLSLPWNMPFGSFLVALDPLSALFLLPLLLLSALAALYGARYLKAEKEAQAIGSHWFFFNLLVAGMIMVLLARNGLLFLIAWEVMSLAPFFLVIFEDHQASARKAAWTYLVAAHLGGVFLILLFILMGWDRATLDFVRLVPGGAQSPVGAGGLFLLALVGFGAKAGFIPLHVWLPEAHPAAPSHVSALMSGIMIKMGIYGLLRILTLIGPPEVWWAYLLIGIGLTSGILGVLFALAQHDLKRLLAYHSVENIGIIALGLGIGLLGLAIGSPTLAVLGFAGGLLHVINHALFKGLLFFGAGAVLRGTGTMEIDHLGGLQKRMPWTGTLFLVGAVAICGLPPLNGFVSEFLIYLGSLNGLLALAAVPSGALVASLAGLALIGGLAVACFTKAYGIIFLGEPRSESARQAREVGLPMRMAMAVLALACVLLGFGGPWVVTALGPVIKTVTLLPPEAVQSGLDQAWHPLTMILYAALGLLFLTVVMTLARRIILSRRQVTRTETWGCGYATPTPRMQYTSSSFAQPLTDLFRIFLHTRQKVQKPKGLFPSGASFSSETPDVFLKGFYEPAFSLVSRLMSGLQWLQQGRVQLYILYIVVTLFLIFIWKLM